MEHTASVCSRLLSLITSYSSTMTANTTGTTSNTTSNRNSSGAWSVLVALEILAALYRYHLLGGALSTNTANTNDNAISLLDPRIIMHFSQRLLGSATNTSAVVSPLSALLQQLYPNTSLSTTSTTTSEEVQVEILRNVTRLLTHLCASETVDTTTSGVQRGGAVSQRLTRTLTDLVHRICQATTSHLLGTSSNTTSEVFLAQLELLTVALSERPRDVQITSSVVQLYQQQRMRFQSSFATISHTNNHNHNHHAASTSSGVSAVSSPISVLSRVTGFIRALTRSMSYSVTTSNTSSGVLSSVLGLADFELLLMNCQQVAALLSATLSAPPLRLTSTSSGVMSSSTNNNNNSHRNHEEIMKCFHAQFALLISSSILSWSSHSSTNNNNHKREEEEREMTEILTAIEDALHVLRTSLHLLVTARSHYRSATSTSISNSSLVIAHTANTAEEALVTRVFPVSSLVTYLEQVDRAKQCTSSNTSSHLLETLQRVYELLHMLIYQEIQLMQHLRGSVTQDVTVQQAVHRLGALLSYNNNHSKDESFTRLLVRWLREIVEVE
jgi:hypothetical protein